MKKIYLLLLALVSSVTFSCVRLGDLGLEPVPDISFKYECLGGLDYCFTSTVPDTKDITWNILNGDTGSGEVFNYTFPTPGIYWVQMSGTYNCNRQTVSTKILVAKASDVKLDDNSFDDWAGVTYPDFIFTGGAYEELSSPILLESKFDYDALNIYFFIQFDSNVRDDINAGSHRFDIFLDVDANTSTGVEDFDDVLGVDYIAQMHIYGGDDDIGIMNGDWDDVDNAEELAEGIIVGHYDTTPEGIVRIEFALSREVWGISGTKIGIGFKIENDDWTDFDALQNSDGDQGMVLDMAKME